MSMPAVPEGVSRNDNKPYSQEYNVKVAYKLDNNWSPYGEIGNVGGERPQRDRQTRFRVGGSLLVLTDHSAPHRLFSRRRQPGFLVGEREGTKKQPSAKEGKASYRKKCGVDQALSIGGCSGNFAI